MDNQFKLVALLHRINELRYTPAGIPVLDVVLRHNSQQEENGSKCQIQFELPAKIIGPNALLWQHQKGQLVCVTGFLAQRSQKNAQPVLRIQTIQQYRG